ALGLGESLAGVSFECDHPAEAKDKPVVSGTALPADLGSAGAIDTAVREQLARGAPIYTLDRDRIGEIQPDLILAQDLCEVCAVPSGAIDEALAQLGCAARVLSLDPVTLEDVIGTVAEVGAATGTEAAATTLATRLHDRVDDVREAVRRVARPRPRVLPLEWSDPPFSAGHWVPDMVDAAGGQCLLAPPGTRSRALAWEDVAAAAPEIVVFAPCGHHLDAAVDAAAPLLEQPALAGAAQFWVVDADSYFSRPGPRVVDGVELLAAILHPDRVGVPDPSRAVRLR
ncbi:MAG TPA: ABC transporter substrate-binding protein, partial [Acidimicrobiales bacterium]|nr:ABC transporter substrate-binding protein [Acidimicrobiales bacterium]